MKPALVSLSPSFWSPHNNLIVVGHTLKQNVDRALHLFLQLPLSKGERFY